MNTKILHFFTILWAAYPITLPLPKEGHAAVPQSKAERSKISLLPANKFLYVRLEWVIGVITRLVL